MADEVQADQPEIGPSGGNLSRVVLVIVVGIILVALAVMLYGATTEGIERADPSSTTSTQ